MTPKIKNGNLKWWLAFILSTGMIVGAWIWNSSAVYSQLNANIAEDEKTHNKLTQETKQNREDILEMKKDITYIRQGIDELRRHNQ